MSTVSTFWPLNDGDGEELEDLSLSKLTVRLWRDKLD